MKYELLNEEGEELNEFLKSAGSLMLIEDVASIISARV